MPVGNCRLVQRASIEVTLEAVDDEAQLAEKWNIRTAEDPWGREALAKWCPVEVAAAP